MATIPPALESLGNAVGHMRMLELARAAGLRAPELQGTIVDQRTRERMEGDCVRGNDAILQEARRLGLGELTQMPGQGQPGAEVPVLQAKARTAVVSFVEAIEELRQRQSGQ